MRFPDYMIHMIHKTGILMVVLALTILIIAPVHAAIARPVPLPDPSLDDHHEALFFFENVSKVVTTEYNQSDFADIPTTISRYDLIEIDENNVRLLQNQILAGNKIPVRFRGFSGFIVMNKTPAGPPRGSDQLSYTGYLEKNRDPEFQTMTLSFYNTNTTLSGIMSETDGPFTTIASITNHSSGRQLYYVYSSTDEKPTGARMDNDVWVMLPSGESKLRNDLSPDEIAWYRNEQRKQDTQSYGTLSVTGSPTTLLLWIVVVGALGICVGLLFRRKK